MVRTICGTVPRISAAAVSQIAPHIPQPINMQVDVVAPNCRVPCDGTARTRRMQSNANSQHRRLDYRDRTSEVPHNVDASPLQHLYCSTNGNLLRQKTRKRKNGSSVLEVAAYGAVGMPKIAPRSDASLPRHSCD